MHFSWNGADILRPTPRDASHPFDTACFPLAPYTNRIANGVFRFEGRNVRAAPNFPLSPHPMHGHAWLAPWRLAEATSDQARIVFERAASDDWPWAYAAQQTVRLSGEGLRVELEIANLSAAVMPVSFGFHPYFPKLPGARLRADVGGVWLADEDVLPTVLAAEASLLPLETGADIFHAPFVDHCHTGWRGPMTLHQPALDLCVTMSASGNLGFLHLFVPNEAGYFCAEPVSAMPDAFNRAEAPAVTGMQSIKPGGRVRAEMRLSVKALNGGKAF